MPACRQILIFGLIDHIRLEAVELLRDIAIDAGRAIDDSHIDARASAAARRRIKAAAGGKKHRIGVRRRSQRRGVAENGIIQLNQIDIEFSHLRLAV